MARPAWKPTAKERETVKTMTGYGIPQHEIAATLRITKPTLEKHCRHELNTGMTQANSAVAASMFKMATKGPYSVRFSAAKFWLAARAGWTEKTGVTLDMLVPIDRMTDAQFDAVMRINGMPTVGSAFPSATATEGNVVTPFPYRPQR